MHSGIFLLGFVLALFGFISDMANYYQQYAFYLIIAGIVLLVIGAFVPGTKTVTERKETVLPEHRTKTVVEED